MLAQRQPLPSNRAPQGGSSFTLVLSSSVSAEALERWFRGAEAGARERYAEGPFVPQGADGVRLARKLANEGRAALHVEGTAPHRVYLIEKLAGPERAVARAVDRGELAALLTILRRCAERGEACPSNNALAKALGLPSGEKSRKRVVYDLARLVSEKRIAVENRGTMRPRVVTILAAGRAQGRSTKA